MSKRPSREQLNKLYHDENLSQQEIGDRFDVAQRTVSTWMDDLKIPTRPKHHRISTGKRHASFNPADANGYERWRAWNSDTGNYDRVYVHRLVGVAKHGFDAVSGKHVHHRNHLPFDNRPSNLKLMTNSDHRTLHEAEKRPG